jgi:hypothetical protein
MDASTSLIPYLKSSSLIVFGIAHVANEAQPMINNVFIKIKCFLFVTFVFDLNIIKYFVGGTLFLKRNVYTDKGGGCGKAGIVNIYHKIYEWHLITQTNYTEQVLQLRL